MPRPYVSDEDLQLRLRRFRNKHFLCIARFRLENLWFGDEWESHLDQNNVQRLRKVFLVQGCLPQTPVNYVQAVIPTEQIQRAIQASGTSEAAFKTPGEIIPELIFPSDYRVHCLHGRHRIAAAKLVFLSSIKRSWPVEIYDEGTRGIYSFL